jgi:hypothetical protein
MNAPISSPISLLQVIGLFLAYAALGYLVPLLYISLNPFQAAPSWIIISALAVLLIGGSLSFLGKRWTPTFKPTRLQWLGICALSLIIYVGVYLLTTHGTNWSGAFSIAVVIIIVFGMQIWTNRSPKSE